MGNNDRDLADGAKSAANQATPLAAKALTGATFEAVAKSSTSTIAIASARAIGGVTIGGFTLAAGRINDGEISDSEARQTLGVT